MATPARQPRQIPQRELRNNIGEILREVERGGHVRVTVSGRPVADLVPIADANEAKTFVAATELRRILSEPVDAEAFASDIAGAIDDEVDDPC